MSMPADAEPDYHKAQIAEGSAYEPERKFRYDIKEVRVVEVSVDIEESDVVPDGDYVRLAINNDVLMLTADAAWRLGGVINAAADKLR